MDVGKKAGQGALRIGGKALSGVGSLAEKAGKKAEEADEQERK